MAVAAEHHGAGAELDALDVRVAGAVANPLEQRLHGRRRRVVHDEEAGHPSRVTRRDYPYAHGGSVPGGQTPLGRSPK